MVEGLGAMRVPPAGVTARVSETEAGTQVTLRPHGIGRWFGAAFLAVWLCGWAAGEVFALYFVAALIGKGLGLWQGAGTPVGGIALAMEAFLLVWVTLWTLGGVAALWTLLRIGWGRDILVLGPGSLSVWHGIGPWGRSRRFDPREVRRLKLQRPGSALTAEIGARTVTLTDLGTEADRCWLRDTLRDAIAGDRVNALAADPSQAPSDYRVETLPDGTLRLAPTAGRRITGSGCLLLVALCWNGFMSVAVREGLRAMVTDDAPPGGAMTFGHWGFWLCLTPFLLVGLIMIAGLFWAVLGSEEWRVGPDLMELRRAFPGIRWNRRYTGSILALIQEFDSDGDESWRLMLHAPGAERRIETGDPAKLRAFGRFLAGHTGWPFREIEPR